MKSVISTTFDDKYLFYLPITTWCWNKLGVETICFAPKYKEEVHPKLHIIWKALNSVDLDLNLHYFECPEHKEATYAQCSRLFASALDLSEDEILITSDVDMAVFPAINAFLYSNVADVSQKTADSVLQIFGSDLVPENQYPMCYAKAPVSIWQKFMYTKGATYQQRLDELLAGIDCENMRANYWAKDQETLFNYTKSAPKILFQRANGQNQFATKRYDRDDQFILDRLSPDIVDFHMNRPGYEDKNFEIILTILKYHYPNDNFDWLISYREQYIKLL